jgi:hypothetical protein
MTLRFSRSFSNSEQSLVTTMYSSIFKSAITTPLLFFIKYKTAAWLPHVKSRISLSFLDDGRHWAAWNKVPFVAKGTGNEYRIREDWTCTKRQSFGGGYVLSYYQSSVKLHFRHENTSKSRLRLIFWDGKTDRGSSNACNEKNIPKLFFLHCASHRMNRVNDSVEVRATSGTVKGIAGFLQGAQFRGTRCRRYHLTVKSAARKNVRAWKSFLPSNSFSSHCSQNLVISTEVVYFDRHVSLLAFEPLQDISSNSNLPPIICKIKIWTYIQH